MIFIVKRTSFGCSDDQPCADVFKKSVTPYDVFDQSEEVYNKIRRIPWKAMGKNHTIAKNGFIKRQMSDVVVWCIRFNGIRQLTAFITEHGQCVIENTEAFDYPVIEIYDSYRE